MQSTEAKPIAGRGSRKMNPVRTALAALLNVGGIVLTVVAVERLCTHLAAGDHYLHWFLRLFAWRYLRFVVNLVAFWCYSPSPRPKGEPTYLPSRDVTVIVPTVDPLGESFQEGLTSIAQNYPAKIMIVTAGDDLYRKTLGAIREIEQQFKSISFVVDRTQVASKRAQVAHAVPRVDTAITVLADDHVFWGPNFLKEVLCPFEDPDVGLVGTNKLVRRKPGLGVWRRFWNMLGATYLCRHNFEIRASNTVDGGVFVVSARTQVMRTELLQHHEFLPEYTNERFLFGLLGPIGADDDNYITRFAVRHGWKIKIQYNKEATMETVLGVEGKVHEKFLGQCRRWSRSTWRSNLCSLITDRSVWVRQPYCVYAVYLTSLTNFAAVVDPLLIYLFTHSRAYVSHGPWALAGLVSWILFTKFTKVCAYFSRHPQDVWLFPAYLCFAYFHSFIKLWALLTFWDCAWSGRRLDEVKVGDDNTGDNEPAPHSHLAMIRAMQSQVQAIRADHAQRGASHHQPLLIEIRDLRGSLDALRREQTLVHQTQGFILAELRRLAVQAEELAAGQKENAVAQGEIAATITALKTKIGSLEEKWRQVLAAAAVAGGDDGIGDGKGAGNSTAEEV